MTLPGTDTLIIEQPWGVLRHLLGTRYRNDVYDQHGTLLASVSERRFLGPLRKLLRATAFSGRTTFDLVLADRGRQVLLIRKGSGKPPTRVTWPNGAAVGSVRHEGHGAYGLLDATGQRLCLLHEVASFRPGEIAKRDGRRVRRDVLTLRPGTPDPVRSLAIAAAAAYDVVRGVGTNHTSPGGFDFPTLT
ncbi:hypothetical protein FHX81_4515 [Saccharothrix saharensis]|uniref:Scramblase n=1 Tax=Saccharothrix saharensis TaxID=571190 RepID=A0A543JH09_9PSEU|nr:hypothetical protein [Saccharothrix saharensis]TQM82120.1 hypothetical protein FHX81_4515 [Saccharothrix saharensis]